LGGHSLPTVRLCTRTRETTDVNLAVADVLREPSLAGMTDLYHETRTEQGR